jgi:A/G-specific adenine glycosylase
MDLGATICLARVPRCGRCPLAGGCPSRGRRFEPLRKQGPFEGSFRQRRAETLRRVATGPQPIADLDPTTIESLAADGLLVIADAFARLPA